MQLDNSLSASIDHSDNRPKLRSTCRHFAQLADQSLINLKIHQQLQMKILDLTLAYSVKRDECSLLVLAPSDFTCSLGLLSNYKKNQPDRDLALGLSTFELC